MSNVHDRVARLQARWKAVPNIEERKEPEGTDGNEQQQPQPQQQQQQQRRRRQQPQRQQQLQQQQRLQQAQYLHTRDASPHRAWNNSSRSLPAATPIVDFDSMEFAESTKVLVEDDASADLDIRSLNVAEPALLSRSRGAHSGFAASEASTKREVFDAAELLPPPLNLGPGLHQRVRNRVLKNFRDWVRENNRNVNRTDTQRRSLPGKFADIFTDKKFFRSFLKQQLRKSNAPAKLLQWVTKSLKHGGPSGGQMRQLLEGLVLGQINSDDMKKVARAAKRRGGAKDAESGNGQPKPKERNSLSKEPRTLAHAKPRSTRKASRQKNTGPACSVSRSVDSGHRSAKPKSLCHLRIASTALLLARIRQGIMILGQTNVAPEMKSATTFSAASSTMFNQAALPPHAQSWRSKRLHKCFRDYFNNDHVNGVLTPTALRAVFTNVQLLARRGSPLNMSKASAAQAGPQDEVLDWVLSRNEVRALTDLMDLDGDGQIREEDFVGFFLRETAGLHVRSFNQFTTQLGDSSGWTLAKQHFGSRKPKQSGSRPQISRWWPSDLDSATPNQTSKDESSTSHFSRRMQRRPVSVRVPVTTPKESQGQVRRMDFSKTLYRGETRLSEISDTNQTLRKSASHLQVDDWAKLFWSGFRANQLDMNASQPALVIVSRELSNVANRSERNQATANETEATGTAELQTDGRVLRLNDTEPGGVWRAIRDRVLSATFDGRDVAVFNSAPSPGIVTPFVPGIPLGIRHCCSLFTNVVRMNGSFDPRRVHFEHLHGSVMGHFATDFFAALSNAEKEEDPPALPSRGSFQSKEKTSYAVEMQFLEVANAGECCGERPTYVDLLSPFAPGSSDAREPDATGLYDTATETMRPVWKVNNNIQFHKAVQHADVMQASDENAVDESGSYEDGTWTFAGATAHPVSSVQEFLAQVGVGLQVRALAKSSTPSTANGGTFTVLTLSIVRKIEIFHRTDNTDDAEAQIFNEWRRTTTIQNFLGRVDFVDFPAEMLAATDAGSMPNDGTVLRSMLDVFAKASASVSAPVRHGFFVHNYVKNTGTQSNAVAHSLAAASAETPHSRRSQHGMAERRSALTVSTQLRKARGVLEKVAQELHNCLEESRAAEAAFGQEISGCEPHAQRLEELRRLCKLLKQQAAALDAFHARKLSHVARLHRIVLDSARIDEAPCKLAAPSQWRQLFLRHCGIAPMTDSVSADSLLLLSVNPWVPELSALLPYEIRSGKTYLVRPLNCRFDSATEFTTPDTQFVYIRDETADLRGPLAPEARMVVSAPGQITLTRPSNGRRVLINGAQPLWKQSFEDGGMVATINDGDFLTLGIAATFMVVSSGRGKFYPRLSLPIIWRDACLSLLTFLPHGLRAPTTVAAEVAESDFEAGSSDGLCSFVKPIALKLPMVRDILLPITASHWAQSDLPGENASSSSVAADDAEHLQIESACTFLITAACAMELSLAACSLFDEPPIHTTLTLSFDSTTFAQDTSSSRFNISRALQFQVQLLAGSEFANQARADGLMTKLSASGSVIELTQKLSLVLALVHRVQSARVARVRHQFLQNLDANQCDLVASAPEWWLKHDSVFVPSAPQRLQDLVQQLKLQ